jgi:hypothetical protein
MSSLSEAGKTVMILTNSIGKKPIDTVRRERGGCSFLPCHSLVVELLLVMPGFPTDTYTAHRGILCLKT